MMNFHRHLPCNPSTVPVFLCCLHSPQSYVAQIWKLRGKKFFETTADGKNCMLIDYVFTGVQVCIPVILHIVE